MKLKKLHTTSKANLSATFVPVDQIYRAEGLVLIAIAIPGLVEAEQNASGISVFALVFVLVCAFGLRGSRGRRQGHLSKLPFGITFDPIAKTVLRCLVQDAYLIMLLVVGVWLPSSGGVAGGIAVALLVANVLKWRRVLRLQRDAGRIYLTIQRRDWLPFSGMRSFGPRLYARRGR